MELSQVTGYEIVQKKGQRVSHVVSVIQTVMFNVNVRCMEVLHQAGRQPVDQKEDQRFTASGSRVTAMRTRSLCNLFPLLTLLTVSELVPVFSSIGRIYELRLMLEFSGATRYVRLSDWPGFSH